MDELRAALELATEEELQELTTVLFSRRFNPLDYLQVPEPIVVQSQDRESWLTALEQRFRFLAADGVTVLRGKAGQITYRQALIQVCRYLKIVYSEVLSTTDLEAEIFLNLLSRTWKHMPRSQKAALTQRVQGTLMQSTATQQLPLSLHQDPIGLLIKGGGALAVSSVLRGVILRQIARQFALHCATYQVAQETLRGGAVVAAQIHNQVALQTARRSMTMTAARYGAVRGLFAVLGPALWAWFFADLGWRAIATNYARVIPTIFALAQIRLTRSDCFEPA
ncbi:hypothetical protein DO97_19380 [Neosynechococcus sphagnicola sy1]|uniref:Uncharacterized protein n=1 Tax=Neosynechococcus sphagnicola sy1 TaxID=1497020 RepID=A0A098THG2_9CYAN|nr:YaaW family protein [Neosynechococcus sphagnicola]KGF71471.1 hypothetical protein DO97_19380 [Neosynechococcus sphagnicola sy1]